MAARVVFLVGSSRGDGNTWGLLNKLDTTSQSKVIDISALDISYFDYEQRNANDDFIAVIEEVLKYDCIGFVSPVYWYTVSAQMKTFIDRFSDLLVSRKDLGRALAGKRTFLIATGGTDETLPQGMEDTVKLTSQYMGMKFQGSFYVKVPKVRIFDDDTLHSANSFIERALR